MSKPTFQPFDPRGEVQIYTRQLPHWRQPGVTYFVTFRQQDSIPAAVLAEWLGEQDRWYRANQIDPTWRITDPQRLSAAYAKLDRARRRAFEGQQHRWLHEELDKCHGSCCLRFRSPRKTLVDALTYFHGRRLWLGDFVTVANHVHALISPLAGWRLESLLGSVKKWTSRRIVQWLKTHLDTSASPNGSHRSKFWQKESYDRIVRDPEELMKFREYIARNPRQARLPTHQYTYHAADWLDEFAPRSRG